MAPELSALALRNQDIVARFEAAEDAGNIFEMAAQRMNIWSLLGDLGKLIDADGIDYNDLEKIYHQSCSDFECMKSLINSRDRNLRFFDKA